MVDEVVECLFLKRGIFLVFLIGGKSAGVVERVCQGGIVSPAALENDGTVVSGILDCADLIGNGAAPVACENLE